MMQTRFPLIWSALAAALLWGCANPVSWENDIHVPVLDDRVTWADVVPDTLYEPGVDGGPAHFVLVDTLDGWDWGEWVTLPDTTISVRYDGEGVLENGVPVQEGMPVALSEDDVPVLEISLSQPEGLELTELTLTSGSMELEVQHSLRCYVDLLYTFPSVMVEGEPLEFGLQLPPATDDAPGVAADVVDLSGASFDFTQADGFDSNALEVNVVAVAGEVTTPEGVYFIDAADSLVLNLTFEALQLEELAGYFGQFTESASADVPLLDTVPLPEPIIDLEGTTAALHFSNTIGADLRLFLDTLQFDETLVEGELIAGHDIPRAVWVNDEPQPSPWSLDLGSPGSTFLDLLETFPRSLHVAGRMQLNPVNTSEYLIDRWDVAYPPTFWYELRVPLKLGVNGLVLRDTFDLAGLDEFPAFDGFLHLDFENTFPVEVTGTIDFARLDGALYQDSLVIPAGSVPLGILGESTLSIPVNADMLLPGGEVAVELRVNTTGPQPFTGMKGEGARPIGRNPIDRSRMKKFLQLSLVASMALGSVSTSTVVGQSMASDVSSTLERGGHLSRFGPINVPTPCPLTFCTPFNKAGFCPGSSFKRCWKTIPCSVAWAVRWDGPIVSAPARWVVDLGR